MDRTEGRPLTSAPEAIAVMAKQPVAGRVKTRLCPPLSHQEAADLYRAFLADTLALVVETRAMGFVAYDPEEAGAFFTDLAAGMACIPQGDGDLGARLARVSKRLFSIGCTKVLILASDAPGIPPEHLSLAFALLDHAELVLGPCDDGGYYLIGTRRHVPALFSGIPWSTSRVLSRTLEQASGEEMTVTLLPLCPDIDTVQDLHRLARRLGETGAGAKTNCPETVRALASIGLIRAVPLSERRSAPARLTDHEQPVEYHDALKSGPAPAHLRLRHLRPTRPAGRLGRDPHPPLPAHVPRRPLPCCAEG